MRKYNVKFTFSIIITFLLITVICTPFLFILAREHTAQELLYSPSWAVGTKKIILSSYMEGENYAGFGSYVNIRDIDKPDLSTTYYFIRILNILGKEPSNIDAKQISLKCLYNLEFLTENPKYKIEEIDKTVCCKEEYIYENLYLLNVEDLDKVRPKILPLLNNLYENERKYAFSSSEGNLQSHLIRLLYIYKSFKILGASPKEIDQDRNNAINLLHNNALFCDISNKPGCSIGFAVVDLLEELMISPENIPQELLSLRKKWFEKQINYIRNIDNPVSLSIATKEMLKTAAFLGVKIRIGKNFLQKILTSENYNGGWGVFGNQEIISPSLTYDVIWILRNTGNLKILSKEDINKLIYYIERLKVKGGFAKPYSVVIDPIGTYYGIKACKLMNIEFNESKTDNYLRNQVLVYAKEIGYDINKLKSMNQEKDRESTKTLAYKILSESYFLLYAKRSLNLINDYEFDGKIDETVKEIARSPKFSESVSMLPANEETLRGFYSLIVLSPKNCLKIIEQFNLLGSMSDAPLKKEFYMKHWGKCATEYIALDAFPPDLSNTKEIFYITDIYRICKKAYSDNNFTFYPGYITFNEHFELFNCKLTYRRRLLSLESRFYGGFRKTDTIKNPDMDDTYLGAEILNSTSGLYSYDKKEIKKFILFTIAKTGGFSLFPSLLRSNTPDFISTAEALMLCEKYFQEVMHSY